MEHRNPPNVAQLDGRAATAADLAPLAFAGYAHFTAMQVRKGRVRGLDLHLSRLRAASLKLFGCANSDEEVLSRLQDVIGPGAPDLSVTLTVFPPSGEFVAPLAPASPSILARSGPPHDGPAGPLKLATWEHERALPHLKHVGEVMKTYALRKAVEEGFDDAAFVNGGGRITEGSIWNLAFWDGACVVWPEGDMLPGVTMGIVRRQLAALGIDQRTQAIAAKDLRGLKGAAVMNSWTPGVPVRAIGEIALPLADEFIRLLHAAYAREEAMAASPGQTERLA